jgi:DedD protein
MAKKGDLEAEDSTLKRQARRRLIGAIALVLLAVIVLPMVFDAEKKPLDADISIQIPNKDAAVTKGPGAITTPPAPSSEGKNDAPAAPGADAKAEAKADAKAEAAVPVKPAAQQGVPQAPKAEPKPDAKATAKAELQRPVPDLAEEKRAAAILNAQADSAKAAKSADKEKVAASGGFAVQVGAFASDDKIKDARDKLSAAGIKTYTEKLDTKDGERTRVRAGPYAAKDAAEAARDRIKGLGFAGAVVVTR